MTTPPETRARARRSRREQTRDEARFWARVRDRRLKGWKFRRQVPIGPYVVDFLVDEAGLVVELDGERHGQDGDAARDRRRDAFLASRGLTVVRFWNRQLREDIDAVIGQILHHLEALSARRKAGPSPGPAGPVRPLAEGEARGERNAALLTSPMGRGRKDAVLPGAGTPAPLSPDGFAAAASVSRETLARLERYDALLCERNARMNLVARSTIADRWRRHYLDSAQLFARIPPGARTLVDLGSGAGFPGLVLAAMGAERGLSVQLVESVKKKAAFLAEAAAAMALANVAVHADRIETLAIPPPDVIVARALARLSTLLAYAHEIAGQATLCLFLKGQDVGVELTEASRYWQMDVERLPSATSAGSCVLAIRQLRAKTGKAPRA